MSPFARFTSLQVCLVAIACLIASATTARAQTTALFLESQAGEPIGAGQTRTYTPANGPFEVSRNWKQGVHFTVRAPDYSFWWYLDFTAAGSVPLTVGSYNDAKHYSSTVGNGLSFSGSGSGCSDLTGRFDILEIALASDGTVLRFAADFEQHCGDANPGLFGAIRYSSTISDLSPFQGNYPLYVFTIAPQVHGRVTGAGLDCGSGQTTCQITAATPSTATVTATANPGYVFTGWTGTCAGAGTTTTVRLNSVKTCEAFFEPQIPATSRTLLYVDSEPGDSVGQGVDAVYSDVNSAWNVSTNSARDRVELHVESGLDDWRITLSAPSGVPLTPGAYPAARRFSSALFNGLGASGPRGSCSTSTGRFVIYEFVTNANGTVARFAADFEQHCNDADPGLFGAIRYNATTSEVVPFGGLYPLYQLTITPPAHGRVTGPGLDCGTSGGSCQTTLVSPDTVTVTAVPDAGYLFAGWTTDCTGSATTSVRINGPRLCGAAFQPLVPTAPRTLLVLDSEPGDYIGGGVDRVYSPANSIWRVRTNTEGSQVSVDLDFEGSWLSLDFSAPQGSPLVPGHYAAARRFPLALFNGLDVSGLGRSCSRLTGRFVVHEFVANPDGTVARFAADFEQHCEDANPGLFGVIRYNTTVGDIVPFGGAYPLYQLTITPPAHGRVTGPGLDCRTSSASCQVVLMAPDNAVVTAVPDFGYLFTGWSGDCVGTATTTVRINGPKQCAASFEPLVTTAPRTLLVWDSEPGDYIGAGVDGAYSPVNSIWRVTTNTARRSVSVDLEFEGGRWSLNFSAPEGTQLVPGYYSAARRYPFTPFNGLSASGSGRGCNTLTGRFQILEIQFTTNGDVQRFAADFEQHCEGANPGLFGAVRYNSTVSEVVPFGGSYPAYQLTLTRSVHGRVTATGMDCGTSTTQCHLALPSAAQLTLTATPDFGYIFTGWTEDCNGGLTTALRVNGPKRCAALFEPATPAAPRTLLRWDSHPSDYIGQGRSEVWSPGNSAWKVSQTGNHSGVHVEIDSVSPTSDSYWTLRFQAPTGTALQPGRYAGADDSPSATVPSLEIYGNGRYCGGGEFTVREVVWGAGPSDPVVRFAVDFTLNCGSVPGSTLTGSLQYRSIVDVPSTSLTVEPSALRFASLYIGTSVTGDPAPQALRLTLSRAEVGWTATANQSWITVTPSSGTGSTAVTVATNLLGGHPGNGSATGTITVTLTDGTGTAKTVNLTVTLHPAGTTTHPFGTIDTPLPDRTGVTGAIPITGWALDDVEVASITICRAAVGGESAPADMNCGGAAQIYIGNAITIEGARPDVQTSYATYPRNDAAGWGFLLLTNTLPNQGNGTFTFHVYARDREGQATHLGTRTMTCDNAHASVPFGTIDTPLQGETVNGTNYVNFGWALTQLPKTIPIDGSTLMVFVDGVPVGNPSYNHFRPDIAAIFPGYANSNGAIGFKIIDTTALANGLHTIVWTATDDQGAIAGLGSRFFRVLNGTTAPAGSLTANRFSAAVTTAVSSDFLAAVPLESSLVVARRGWSPDAPWGQYAAGRSGRTTLRGEELDRFELVLGAETGTRYTGYLRVGDRLRPLPAGSRLDAETGVFTWSPGVGFVGTYDVVFVRTAGGQPVARREVRIILQPKGSGYVGVQAVIETPGAERDVVQPFAVSGWAVDLDSASGPGINTLHVWAYPASGGAPVFVGATRPTAARADVAAIHGDQFREAGFALVVQSLPPGTYDLAVFPWSTVIGAFAPPQSVRVTVR